MHDSTISHETIGCGAEEPPSLFGNNSRHKVLGLMQRIASNDSHVNILVPCSQKIVFLLVCRARELVDHGRLKFVQKAFKSNFQ